ncbi:Uncharacterised protein [Vibrio cholerae]|nr:Uncharacterised protein [Vibrio cholerae]
MWITVDGLLQLSALIAKRFGIDKNGWNARVDESRI